MDTSLPQNKSVFQTRRILQDEHFGQPTPKEKFSIKKFLKQKSIPVGKKLQRIPVFKTAKRAVITSIILVVLVSGGSAFAYYQYLLSQNPAVVYTRKVQSMTDTVSKQVTLPKDEQPVIATVSDISKLPNEAFFNDAKNGDKILMYKKNKKAILYRPGTQQVITVAALDFRDAKPTPMLEQGTVAPMNGTVAGASTSAATGVIKATIVGVTVSPISPSPTIPYRPQGKILVQPQ